MVGMRSRFIVMGRQTAVSALRNLSDQKIGSDWPLLVIVYLLLHRTLSSLSHYHLIRSGGRALDMIPTPTKL